VEPGGDRMKKNGEGEKEYDVWGLKVLFGME
jgi:hypothetical protein